MINYKTKKNKGFTLVETLVAVFILSLTIISLMTVVANSLFAARYARDEIIASYLLQEAVDYIHNDRDTTIFLNTNEGVDETWSRFISKYAGCGDENQGCYIDIFKSIGDTDSPDNIKICDYTTCPKFFHDPNSDTAFYNYSGNGTETNFIRKIVVINNLANPDEIFVKVTVSWINGGVSKSRLLQTSLTKWQL